MEWSIIVKTNTIPKSDNTFWNHQKNSIRFAVYFFALLTVNELTMKWNTKLYKRNGIVYNKVPYKDGFLMILVIKHVIAEGRGTIEAYCINAL